MAAAAASAGGARMLANLPRRPQALTKLINVMQSIAPTKYAGSWDNVGLLLDTAAATYPTPAVVYVTNDLTEKVVADALKEEANMIVTYHPTPFRAPKRITRDNPTARIIMALAHRGVAVYAPHTALDCAAGGLNDWLAGGCGTGTIVPIKPTDEEDPRVGEGRLLTLEEPCTLGDVIARVKAHLGLAQVRVAPSMAALPDAKLTAESAQAAAAAIPIKTVATCAGSGSSVLGGCKADVWLTGEMSHHDILAANHSGISVILTDHSNTERPYLPILAQRIEDGMASDAAGLGKAVPVTVKVSNVDADPLVIV